MRNPPRHLPGTLFVSIHFRCLSSPVFCGVAPIPHHRFSVLYQLHRRIWYPTAYPLPPRRPKLILRFSSFLATKNFGDLSSMVIACQAVFSFLIDPKVWLHPCSRLTALKE
eukprot:RCo015733